MKEIIGFKILFLMKLNYIEVKRVEWISIYIPEILEVFVFLKQELPGNARFHINLILLKGLLWVGSVYS